MRAKRNKSLIVSLFRFVVISWFKKLFEFLKKVVQKKDEVEHKTLQRFLESLADF